MLESDNQVLAVVAFAIALISGLLVLATYRRNTKPGTNPHPTARSPQLRTWVYVEVRDPAQWGGRLSFSHAIVQAPDEDTAYSLGPSLINRGHTGHWEHSDGDPRFIQWPFINDYVIDITEAER